MRDYKRLKEIFGKIIINKNVLLIMDYKSFKHVKLALIINYNFASSTIIIII